MRYRRSKWRDASVGCFAMERKRCRVQELLASGELSEAKRLCKEGLEGLDRAERAETWYLLGLVHDIAHEHGEVARCMRQALSYNERPEIWTYLAVAWRRIGYNTVYYTCS